MKVRTLGLLGVVGALAVVPAASADSGRDRVTGGGQVLLDPNEPPRTGALDTVAFQAQEDKSGVARGQVQVNRRGEDALKFHGIVDCLVVIGGKSHGEAFISGFTRGSDPADPDNRFELYVTDGGTGQDERGTDVTMLWFGPEQSENEPDQIQNDPNNPVFEDSYCGIEEDPEQRPALARGNNQVYDSDPMDPAPSSGSQAPVSTRTAKAVAVALASLR